MTIRCPVPAEDRDYFDGLDEPIAPACHDCAEACGHNPDPEEEVPCSRP